jgi:phospholipase C
MCAVPAVADTGGSANAFGKINHIVVIYEENHSFDNLYGGWEGVNGRANADPSHTLQVGQGGLTYACLLQDDVNLALPQLPATCNDTTTATPISSAFTNQPFGIEAYIPATARTCPQPGASFPAGSSLPNPNNVAGGCTRDIVHRFYQEQFQLNNGAQNRYVTGSDAVGLTMGY